MFLVSIAFFYSLIICALYDVYMYIYKVNKDYYYYYYFTNHIIIFFYKEDLMTYKNLQKYVTKYIHI